jgi:hypothetical protein
MSEISQIMTFTMSQVKAQAIMAAMTKMISIMQTIDPHMVISQEIKRKELNFWLSIPNSLNFK